MTKTTPTNRLMTPGPVPLPPEVLEVLALPMEHHRTPEFIALFARVLTNLKSIYMTKQPVFIHTSTGSGGMESALVNCLSPGDTVLCIVSGKFGERWAEMAEIYGMKTLRIDVPWGQVVKRERVEELLQQNPQIKAVLCQACETSTATLHPIRELAMTVAKTPALFMVDAITALGALPIPMDEWGIDVLIGGSQKAFMLPTGLSFISLSEKAWKLAESAKCPRFYFDLRAEKKAYANNESHFSASVTHIRALDLVLKIFMEKGMHRVHERIQSLARATLLAAREMGLAPFSEMPSPSVTAIKIPEGIDGQKVRATMEKDHHVIVMGGQDQLKGKIVRVGHMGAISDDDMHATVKALAQSLNSEKAGLITDAQIAKALSVLQEELSAHPAVVMA